MNARITLSTIDHPIPDAVQRLGGKGASLVDMRARLGLPVPPAFVIETSTYKVWRASGWPAELDEHIRQQLTRLQGTRSPLLWSVRSSGTVSMPGMMDTILNVGATPDSIAALRTASSDSRFAEDTWRRFCWMYAKTVLRIPENDLLPCASADAIRTIALQRGTPIPVDPLQQLRGAIEAVFASWDSERARSYRRREGISDELGTAVVVQAMVFGNQGATSGTGVAFTRDPATGEAKPCGDFVQNAQGEDVVSGSHNAGTLEDMRRLLPEAHDELIRTLHRLELHYRDLCDVEFTVEQGKLWILQTRVGKRSPAAAVRIAVEMAEDPAFPLERAEAVRRVTADQLQKIGASASIKEHAVAIASGVPASPGIGVGVICRDAYEAARLAQSGKPVVLIRPTTSPDDVHGMMEAAAVLTITGGMMSHAAVVARGWGVPAVTGASSIEFLSTGVQIGEHFVADGSVISVDGSTGRVYLGDQCVKSAAISLELIKLREWARTLESEVPASELPTVSGVVTSFSLLRAIQLRGLASESTLAEMLMTTPDSVAAALTQANSSHIEKLARGLRLTAAGRSWVSETLDRERETLDKQWIEPLFERFHPLDGDFKRLVTAWQLREVSGEQIPNDHSDAAYDSAVLDQLEFLHARVRPLVNDLATKLDRLAAIGLRLDRARERLRKGVVSMLASPREDSYHTVWFELHEELIQLSGRTRRAIEASIGGQP